MVPLFVLFATGLFGDLYPALILSFIFSFIATLVSLICIRKDRLLGSVILAVLILYICVFVFSSNNVLFFVSIGLGIVCGAFVVIKLMKKGSK